MRRALVPSRSDEAGQLDMRFLKQRFQSVVQLHAVARDLALAAHHRPPEPLLRVRHKTRGELLGHQALHQSFGIRKVPFAPAGTTIGLGLRKVKGPEHGARSYARPAPRPPVLLQCLPHGSPVLRGRFHHHFLDLLLDQPLGEEAATWTWSSARIGSQTTSSSSWPGFYPELS